MTNDPLAHALYKMDELYFSKYDVPDKWVIRARVRAMCRAYHTVWAEDNKKYTVLSTEQLMTGPLINLENGKDSGYIKAGKLDLLWKEKTGRGRVILVDHKFLSTSLSIDKIEHLMIDGQNNVYPYLAHCNGIKVDACIRDVITKSQHVPRKESVKVTPEKVYKRAYKGLPAGTVIPEIREVTPGETMEEFEDRVTATYCENYMKYFARPEVPVLQHNIVEHMHEAYLWTKELDMDSLGDIHLKNEDACMKFERPCAYLGLCSGNSYEDDGTWRYKSSEELHSELDLPPGIEPGRVITNSRLKMFKECRLKHYRQYVQGLVKIERTFDPALEIGTVGHIGLQYYFESMQTEN